MRWLNTRTITPLLFMAPVLVFAIVFFFLPVGFSLYISFHKWDSLSPPEFYGFTNYVYLLSKDPQFYRTLVNTFVFAGGTIAIGIPLALVVAYSFSQSRFQTVWRSIYWLPMITNIVAVAFIWKFVLNDAYGMLNRGLALVGLPGPGWLTNPSLSMFSVIMVFVWMQLGHNMLLVSAGLQSIDDTYYEAARIDGAHSGNIFWDITLPLLKPTILFLLITNFITGISYFALMMVLTEGGPAGSTNVTSLYMYNMAFSDLRLGRASAAAYILFALIFIVTLIQLRLFRRGGVEAHN
ncbi:MAG: sugar transporter permease [Devosia sp.]|nr:sugar transporter permease [Devosia sp.]